MNLRNYNKVLVWNKCSENILLWILSVVALPRWYTAEQCYEIYLMNIYVALLCFVANKIYDDGSDDKAAITTLYMASTSW